MSRLTESLISLIKRPGAHFNFGQKERRLFGEGRLIEGLLIIFCIDSGVVKALKSYKKWK